MRQCGVADLPAQLRKIPGCRVFVGFFQLGRTGVGRSRDRVSRDCLRVVACVQQGRQRHHEPALYGVVAVVVYKLERLDVRYQASLAGAAVLFEPPFQQADTAHAVVRVDLVVLAGGELALAVAYGMVVVPALLEVLVPGVLVGHHCGAGLYPPLDHLEESLAVARDVEYGPVLFAPGGSLVAHGGHGGVLLE